MIRTISRSSDQQAGSGKKRWSLSAPSASEMSFRHAAALALVGWALMIPTRVKTCPKSGPCAFSNLVEPPVLKAVYLERTACESAAMNWQSELNDKLAKQGKVLVGPERAFCAFRN